MTQSQNEKACFPSATSLLAWASDNQPLRALYSDHSIIYVLKDKMYYYFGIDSTGIFSLICTSERDLGEMK